jgi:hypothetical protein
MQFVSQSSITFLYRPTVNLWDVTSKFRIVAIFVTVTMCSYVCGLSPYRIAHA